MYAFEKTYQRVFEQNANPFSNGTSNCLSRSKAIWDQSRCQLQKSRLTNSKSLVYSICILLDCMLALSTFCCSTRLVFYCRHSFPRWLPPRLSCSHQAVQLQGHDTDKNMRPGYDGPPNGLPGGYPWSFLRSGNTVRYPEVLCIGRRPLLVTEFCWWFPREVYRR